MHFNILIASSLCVHKIMEHADNTSLLLGCNNQAFPFQLATGDFCRLCRAQSRSLVTKRSLAVKFMHSFGAKMSSASPDYFHLQKAIGLLLQLKRKTLNYITLLATL